MANTKQIAGVVTEKGLIVQEYRPVTLAAAVCVPSPFEGEELWPLVRTHRA